jgi:3-oxoacyl-[acyl-carrier protein] reductase
MARHDGKVAIVTGASGGIGQAVAVRLAADGAEIALFGQNVERLEATAAKVREQGRRAECFQVDSKDPEAIEAAVAKVQQAWSRIDILVNNAGITKDGLLIRMSVNDWDEVMDVNLRSVFLFTKAVARTMMKQRAGAIVNVSSIIGLIGNPGPGQLLGLQGRHSCLYQERGQGAGLPQRAGQRGGARVHQHPDDGPPHGRPSKEDAGDDPAGPVR